MGSHLRGNDGSTNASSAMDVAPHIEQSAQCTSFIAPYENEGYVIFHLP